MTVTQNIAFAQGKRKNINWIRDMLERFYIAEVAEQYPAKI